MKVVGLCRKTITRLLHRKIKNYILLYEKIFRFINIIYID